MARSVQCRLLTTATLLVVLLTCCGVATAQDGAPQPLRPVWHGSGSVALVADTNSSHVERRHLLSHGTPLSARA
jgi:hypothetical protein